MVLNMSRNPLIYLAGKMTGLSIEDAMAWRSKFFDEYAQHVYETPNIFNPVLYYNDMMSPDSYSDKEVFRYEMRTLKTSTIVVVNLDQIESSVGTLQEIAVAYTYDIPVIGLNEHKTTLEDAVESLHPWLVEEIDKIFVGPDCYRAAATYIYNYYGDVKI